jgi:hypothetical protein
MRPLRVVVTHIGAEHVLELAAVEDQQPVEALAPYAADPALNVSVRVRRPHRRPDHSDPFALADRVEGAAELRVSVVDQEPRLPPAIIEVDQQVARVGCTNSPAYWIRPICRDIE